jgi:hypothetical protein
MVHHLIVGASKRLFNGLTTTALRPVDITTTRTGVVVLAYKQPSTTPLS